MPENAAIPQEVLDQLKATADRGAWKTALRQYPASRWLDLLAQDKLPVDAQKALAAACEGEVEYLPVVMRLSVLATAHFATTFVTGDYTLEGLEDAHVHPTDIPDTLLEERYLAEQEGPHSTDTDNEVLKTPNAAAVRLPHYVAAASFCFLSLWLARSGLIWVTTRPRQ